jgi:hypothetical protein
MTFEPGISHTSVQSLKTRTTGRSRGATIFAEGEIGTVAYILLRAPIGDNQPFLGLKGYDEFDAANRLSGWNTWLTFSISEAAPASTMTPTEHVVRK